jgi:hypothetical protein
MDILGWIGYGVASFAVAIVLTLVYSLFRPIKKHDEILSWRVLAVLYLITLFSPYGYILVLTHLYATPMETAVRDLSSEVTKQGKFEYFRILSYRHDKARVIAVNTELSSWGGHERSVMGINMEKVDGKWEAVEFNWITSDQRNRDSVSLPPFL